MRFGFNLGVSRMPLTAAPVSGGGGGEDTLPLALIDINFSAGTYMLGETSLTFEQALLYNEGWPTPEAAPGDFTSEGLTAASTTTDSKNAAISLHPDLFAELPDGFVAVMDCILDTDDERAAFVYIRPARLPEFDSGGHIGIKADYTFYPTIRSRPYIADDLTTPSNYFSSTPLATETRIAARFDVPNQLFEASAMGEAVNEIYQGGNVYSDYNSITFFVGVGTPGIDPPTSTSATMRRVRFYAPDAFPGDQLMTASIPPGEDAPFALPEMNPDHSMNGGEVWSGDESWSFVGGEARCNITGGGTATLQATAAEEITQGPYQIDFRFTNPYMGNVQLFFGGILVYESTDDANYSGIIEVYVDDPANNLIQIIVADITTVPFCSIIKLEEVVVPPATFPINLDFVNENYTINSDSTLGINEILEVSEAFANPSIPFVVTPGIGLRVADDDAGDFEVPNLGVAFMGGVEDLLLTDGFVAVFEYEIDLPADEVTLSNASLAFQMFDEPDGAGMWQATLYTSSFGFPDAGTDILVGDNTGSSAAVNGATTSYTVRGAVMLRADALAIAVNGSVPQIVDPASINDARNTVGFSLGSLAYGVMPASTTLKWMVLYDPADYDPEDMQSLSDPFG